MPYYAQGNGQAEATNKIIIELIKKNIEDRSMKWHETLNEILWAMRNAKSIAIGITPYRLGNMLSCH